MKRKMLDELKKWKDKPERKPLIIEGARQVGKTYLIEKEFAPKFFDNFVRVNLQNPEPEIAALFEGNIQPRRIIEMLEILYNTKIVPGKTLIFFDEVQEVPRALTALKYFYEEAPEYHIVVAGSLLGVYLNRPSAGPSRAGAGGVDAGSTSTDRVSAGGVNADSAGTSRASTSHDEADSKQASINQAVALRADFPVGKVETLRLEPMDFEEFLDAKEMGRMVSAVKKDLSVTTFDERLADAFREYLIVGGMPAAVQSWVTHHDVTAVAAIQRAILSDYEHDFAKYTDETTANRIRQIFARLPQQFAKANEKFMYGVVREGARAREYEMAVEWLVNAGMVRRVVRISRGDKMPLRAYAENEIFKLYFLDVGLFRALAEIEPRVIMEKERIFEEFGGLIAEQFVLQQLAPRRVYYWASASEAEVDFVIQEGELIVPIEVKSGLNVYAKSLRVYREKYRPRLALRFSMLGFQEEDEDGAGGDAGIKEVSRDGNGKKFDEDETDGKPGEVMRGEGSGEGEKLGEAMRGEGSGEDKKLGEAMRLTNFPLFKIFGVGKYLEEAQEAK